MVLGLLVSLGGSINLSTDRTFDLGGDTETGPWRVPVVCSGQEVSVVVRGLAKKDRSRNGWTESPDTPRSRRSVPVQLLGL